MRWPWACVEPAILARGVAEGLTRWSRFHLDRCERCRSTWDGARRLLEAARDLPVPEMGTGIRGRIADRVVAAALKIDAEKAREEMLRARAGRIRGHGTRPVSHPNH